MADANPLALLEKHAAALSGKTIFYVEPPKGVRGAVWRTTEVAAWNHKITADAAVLFWPPTVELARYLLSEIAAETKGLEIYTVGAVNEGIRRAPEILAEFAEGVEKLALGNHCHLYRAKLKHAARREWMSAFEAEVAGVKLTITALPGVFSAGRLDAGTKLLLETLPMLPDNAKVLDFGCGAGVIGAFIKKRQAGVTINASDVSALAIESTKATFARNNLGAIEVFLGSGLASVPGKFTHIISNPPFHAGKQVDRSIAENLVKEAGGKLMKGGSLRVVANRFLPYKKLMEELGPVEVIAETPAFWVLEAKI